MTKDSSSGSLIQYFAKITRILAKFCIRIRDDELFCDPKHVGALLNIL